jgi:GTPase
VKKFVKDYGWKGRVFAISAISGIGCKELTYAIMDHLDEVKKITLENEQIPITE